MILLIDNYDSFTYNLVQYFGELREKINVVRNDKISVSAIKRLKPSYIVISPGPCTPKEAGISCDVIGEFYKKIPILGVCLGHQCIGEAFGAEIVRAPVLMHGKTSNIFHDQQTIFKGIPNPFVATRYHSLIIEERTLPKYFKITARSDDNLIMGIKHNEYPVWGVQFHPESILTKDGKQILENFLNFRRGA
ncbi:MAG: aminodeoxychorismate/anthranilate synthase component II [Candidatus Omnitrophica bacterium]|nr:aminodeoxychorismate/anthranilate synthase component II [Candidatus Omnitrophota bacterium]